MDHQTTRTEADTLTSKAQASPHTEQKMMIHKCGCRTPNDEKCRSCTSSHHDTL